MPKIATIMAAGNAAASAQAIVGYVSNSITATGSTQTDAYPIGASNTVFTTVAASTGGVLPSASSAGDRLFVTNLGANTLSIYPPVGGTINNLSANTAFSVATLKSCYFMSRDGTNWVSNLSA